MFETTKHYVFKLNFNDYFITLGLEQLEFAIKMCF